MEPNKFSIIIPARLESTRLSHKALLDIEGKSMLERTWIQAKKSRASWVIIATDNSKIYETAKKFGADVCWTKSDHPSGTDRVQEAVEFMGLKEDEIVVNLQCDEPLIHPQALNQVVEKLTDPQASVSTLKAPITDTAQCFNPNIVKLVTDSHDYALYFSRAPIPWQRYSFPNNLDNFSSTHVHQHLGIYAYRVKCLNEFVKLAICPLELLEGLEQLRFLTNRYRIHTSTYYQPMHASVDTLDDLNQVRAYIMKQESVEA